VCVCVDCLHLRCLSNIVTDKNHMASGHVKKQITKDEKSVGLEKYYVWRPLNYWHCEQLHRLPLRICVTCPNRLGLQKIVERFVHCILFIYLSEETTCPIIPIALTAHHTPNLMSCKALVCYSRIVFPPVSVIWSIYAVV